MSETTWADGASFNDALSDAAKLSDTAIDRLLVVPSGFEARVVEAMRYAALAPGKRLRPFLVFASAQLFSVGRR
ncbi:MAG: polyprenyl synthetase family protein, partial [Alphaproteobacteria bacterium]|nr:polyprenyl synthetase family protein [Alphaproteobacteria bacterium]